MLFGAVLDWFTQIESYQTAHFLIYKTGNKKQLSQIYDNFATFVTEAEFLEVYQHATSEPYGFLYIDTDPKEPHMRFRNGFNEFFQLK